jgi:uncharacterized membrane protein YoaK (UPF0700 family)
VSTFFTDIRETLLPRPGGRDGPLPQLLVGLTVVTGLVDAFSYLVLGHVFVANMTGNVVFLGFALAGAPGFSVVASVVAVGAFWFGALVGGRFGAELGQNRGQLLSTAASLQALLVAVAVALAVLSPTSAPAGYRYPLIVVLAIGMGIQNATARKLAVADLTTTVLTLTITGSAADSALVGGKGSSAGRRALSVGAMIVGALVGAEFVVHVDIFLPLVVALVVLVSIAVISRARSAADAPWLRP